MQYSMPLLIDSGVSPFHHTGAGSDTCTVSWPGTAGPAIGIEPFAPVSSQLPIVSAAEDIVVIAHTATPAIRKRLAKIMSGYSAPLLRFRPKVNLRSSFVTRASLAT